MVWQFALLLNDGYKRCGCCFPHASAAVIGPSLMYVTITVPVVFPVQAQLS